MVILGIAQDGKKTPDCDLKELKYKKDDANWWRGIQGTYKLDDAILFGCGGNQTPELVFDEVETSTLLFQDSAVWYGSWFYAWSWVLSYYYTNTSKNILKKPKTKEVTLSELCAIQGDYCPNSEYGDVQNYSAYTGVDYVSKLKISGKNDEDLIFTIYKRKIKIQPGEEIYDAPTVDEENPPEILYQSAGKSLTLDFFMVQADQLVGLMPVYFWGGQSQATLRTHRAQYTVYKSMISVVSEDGQKKLVYMPSFRAFRQIQFPQPVPLDPGDSAFEAAFEAYSQEYMKVSEQFYKYLGSMAADSLDEGLSQFTYFLEVSLPYVRDCDQHLLLLKTPITFTDRTMAYRAYLN